ncbi:SNARE associated Golgi protein family domain-containing protein, putative [Eimeria tenella]|uniref:SNARE associated Golgi protein family domain-containing protein, putative n=1 Tax=Eimeria tenella TaxID=5802 RepID=U6KY04_EIMTE|nr:SNARE associated Golgi protein family domain-containing protein, putative [Eimeria tenella]CDJ41828.1 SNARE associated Golgi protein family domain-containing protein, putative [Eimeria tenella]|eukprot:XP_013232578.1 SNARE associated Golgi protein family domain-containing protein, putative [Eimeria tenella]
MGSVQHGEEALVGHLPAQGLDGPREGARVDFAPERGRVIFIKFGFMALLFVCALWAMAILYLSLPGLTEEARAELESVFPTSFSDLGCLRDIKTLRKLCAAIGVYRQQHPVALALLLSYVYLLYQAFPLFMFPFSGLAMAVTLLLGALYSPLVAFSLASALSAIGPSLSYFLFKAAGKPLVVRLFPNQLQRMRQLIHPTESSSACGSGCSDISSSSNIASNDKSSSAAVQLKQKTQTSAEPQGQHQQQREHRQQHLQPRQHRPRCAWDTELDLMLTVLFLRVSPFPNLVINAASPVLDVPFGAFFVATWLVSMGSALGSLDSLSSGWRPLAVFVFGAFAVVLLKTALRKLRPCHLAEQDAPTVS